MEMFFEAAMVVALCIGVGIQLFRFAAGKSVHIKGDRCTVIAMGVAFLFGGTSKAMMTPIPWIFGLYIVGVWLCYCAAVFSFPGKKGTAHE